MDADNLAIGVQNTSNMLESELAYVKGRNPYKTKTSQQDASPRLMGLALSGGGIRSAAFGSGVMQALVQYDIMGRFDYLSTVSGGGFIGSSLSWHGRDAATEDAPVINEENYPLGQNRAEAGTSYAGKTQNFIRQRASFLAPSRGLNAASLVTVALRSVVVSNSVYLPLLFALLMMVQIAGGFSGVYGLWNPILCFIAPAIVALYFVFSVAYALLSSLQSDHRKPYRQRLEFQVISGRMMFALVVSLGLGSLPVVVNVIDDVGLQWQISSGITLTGLTGFVSLLGPFSNPRDAVDTKTKLKLLVVAGLLIYGVLLLLYGSVEALGQSAWPTQLGSVVVALSVSAIIGWLTQLNDVSLHRMYRDRLMEWFLPDRAAIENGHWGFADEANTAPLSELSSVGQIAPYHLINANVVLSNSKKTSIRGRGGDSFLLSSKYCGSVSTGYVGTKDFMDNQMTLATAMAVSGIAVNPGANVGGRGGMRNRLVSMLMSVMGLRLGYWVRNPRHTQWTKSRPPNFFNPGFSSLIGRGMTEEPTEAFVELNDGGHFENLGMYELIRRRLDTIVVSDAGQDNNFQFTDLANAIQRVRIDFGVDVRFEEECDLTGLIPEPMARGRMGERYGVSHRGFAIAKISYPEVVENGAVIHPPKEGILFYVKASLIKGLPIDVYSYKSENPGFPDESTGDQFFDERQFEVYRELGQQLCASMLKHNLTHDYLKYL